MNTLLTSIGIITGFNFIFGIILGFIANYFKTKDDSIVEKINRVLPQSQCCQCNYPGCHAYAEAIINDNENINKCTPGGKRITFKIAELLNIELQIFNEDNFISEQKVAFIDETNCIGCTKCVQICPVDAIVGARRLLHTVIKDLCTGCNLCVAPCPTDCITMLPVKNTIKNWKWDLTNTLIKNVSIVPNAIPITTFTKND